MQITLSPSEEKMIAEKVESGEYDSASEVLSAGLQFLKEREQTRREREDYFRRELQNTTREPSTKLDMQEILKKARRRMEHKYFKKEIQKGIGSGPATPWDLEEFLKMAHKKAGIGRTA